MKLHMQENCLPLLHENEKENERENKMEWNRFFIEPLTHIFVSVS